MIFSFASSDLSLVSSSRVVEVVQTLLMLILLPEWFDTARDDYRVLNILITFLDIGVEYLLAVSLGFSILEEGLIGSWMLSRVTELLLAINGGKLV